MVKLTFSNLREVSVLPLSTPKDNSNQYTRRRYEEAIPLSQNTTTTELSPLKLPLSHKGATVTIKILKKKKILSRILSFVQYVGDKNNLKCYVGLNDENKGLIS